MRTPTEFEVGRGGRCVSAPQRNVPTYSCIAIDRGPAIPDEGQQSSWPERQTMAPTCNSLSSTRPLLGVAKVCVTRRRFIPPWERSPRLQLPSIFGLSFGLRCLSLASSIAGINIKDSKRFNRATRAGKLGKTLGLCWQQFYPVQSWQCFEDPSTRTTHHQNNSKD